MTKMPARAPRARTVLISGFGPVGAACAAALSLRLADSVAIVVLDSRPMRASPSLDTRMLAVSHGSRVLLERLGAWNGEEAAAIRQIHVSERLAFGRTLLKASDYGIDALGYVIPYRALATMLIERARALPVEVRTNVRIEHCKLEGDGCHVALSDGGSIDVDYVIHAEGQPEGQPAQKSRDYEQHALSALVTCERPLAYTAFERFTREGPLALLPAKNGYALVWCARPEETERRMALADAALLGELHDMFGDRLGKFTSIRARSSVPLGLQVAQNAPKLREFAIGNAAQALHPVAGQGFNLGLRDAFCVGAAIARNFDDPAKAESDFLVQRRRDRHATIGVTDLLSRVFATPLWPLRPLRGAALALLDVVPALRHPLARHMMNGQR